MKLTTINKKWPLVRILIIVVILVVAGIKYFSKAHKEYSDITKYTEYRALTDDANTIVYVELIFPGGIK